MNKRLFLTSALCMCIALPAMANIASDAENPTCDQTTIGATSGSTSLEAQWTPNDYSCPAGQYLRASDATCQTCLSGSYCKGFYNETFADADIGAQSCSGIENGGYPYSAVGATWDGYCYATTTTTCAAKNPYYFGHGTANYATAGTINCKEYYGIAPGYNDMTNGNVCTLDTLANCNITSLSCDSGYSQTGTNGVLANYVNDNAFDSRVKDNDGSSTRGDQTGLSNGSWVVTWKDGTTVSGIASCNTTNSIGSVIQSEGAGLTNGTISQEQFISDISAVGTPAQVQRTIELLTQYLNGNITWDELSIHIVKDLYTDSTANYNTSSTGQYCWCKMDGYSLLGGANVSASSAVWMFGSDRGSASVCASDCAFFCADVVKIGGPAWRAGLFGSLGINMKCAPNTINIDWDPANGGSHTQNTCTYDDVVTLPEQPSKTGYTFGGWSVKVNNNNNNN